MAGTSESGGRRQSAAEARLKGNPGKRPDRVQECPLPDGEPNMPETLGPEGVRVWRFVLEQCRRVAGMVKQIDEFSLGMFCHALEDVYEIRKRLQEDGQTVGELPVNMRKALREAEATAIKLGARFGWSPSDRVGKVFGSQGGPEDPLQALLKRRSGVN